MLVPQTCFYEASTRTRLSFEAAMLNLGGSVLGFSSADSSSASKGESVSDTIQVISCYADICAMRHPKEGAPLVASEKSKIPVINAGRKLLSITSMSIFLRIIFNISCQIKQFVQFLNRQIQRAH